MRRKDDFIKNNKYICNNYINKYRKCKTSNCAGMKNKRIRTYKKLSSNDFLNIKDILNIIFIFEESNIKEKKLFFLTEAEIEYQSYFVNKILKINFRDKMLYINKINKRILYINTDIENYIIVKKYLILYFFVDYYYKNTIIMILNKLEVIFKI